MGQAPRHPNMDNPTNIPDTAVQTRPTVDPEYGHGAQPRLDQRIRVWIDRFPSWSGALLGLILLCVITAVMEPAFVRPDNLVNILNQNATVGIVAVGMTLVIILAGIDLSVGSLLALAGGVGILALNVGGPDGGTLTVLRALAVMVIVGTLAGGINGTLIAKGNIAPFIATLGALVAFRSAAVWIADGGQFRAMGPALFTQIGSGWPIPGTNVSRVAGRVTPLVLPCAVIIWALVAVVGAILLNRTRLGRYIIAIGSNERSALYSAIPVDRVKIITYSLLGLMVGIAAVVEATKFNSINSSNTGTLLELDVIAAVVIGGTRMQGGVGSIGGTIIGVLLIGVIKNMLVMQGVTSHAHGLVMGVIIILAALIQQVGRRK